MKSTNRQSNLKNESQNPYFVNMFILNLMLMSCATIKQSFALPTGLTYLAKELQQHPNFRETLLSKTVVPFLEDCDISMEAARGNASEQSSMLCGSYFEMVAKLDASNTDTFRKKHDIDDAMKVYKINANNFCNTFPDHIPKDSTLFPQSSALYNFVNETTRCSILCLDVNVKTFVQTVKQSCGLIDSGFLHTEKAVKPSVPSTKNTISDATVHTETGDSKVNQTQTAHVEPQNESKNISLKSPEHHVDTKPSNITATHTSQNEVKVSQVGEKPKLALPLETKSTLSTIVKQPKSNVPVEPEVPNSQNSPELDIEEPVESFFGNEKWKLTTIASDNSNLLDSNIELYDSKIDTNPGKDKVSEMEDVNKDINEDGDESKRIDDGNDDDDERDDDVQNIPSKSVPEQPSKAQLLENSDDPFYDDTDSNFFTYFMFLLLVCVIAYVVYHNKTKMLALMLEGRRSSTSGRGGLSRRKHTAAYRKLDSNLEEAITSNVNGRSTQVIY